MVALPAATAVTTPDAEFTDAAAGLLLLQVPPVPVLVNVVDKPAHTVAAPLTTPAFGSALTVIIVDADEVAQSDVDVYVIV